MKINDFLSIKDKYIGGTIELFKDEYFGDLQTKEELTSIIKNITFDDYQPNILVFIGNGLVEAIDIYNNIQIEKDKEWLVFITTYSEGFRIKQF